MNIDTEHQDPLVYYLLSRVYRDLELWEDADRSGSILGVSLSHGLANIFLYLYLVLPFLFANPTAQWPFTQVTIIPAIVRPATPTKFVAASFPVTFGPVDVRTKIAPPISVHTLVKTIKTFMASTSFSTITCVLTRGMPVLSLSTDMNILASYTGMPPPLAETPTSALPPEEPLHSILMC